MRGTMTTSNQEQARQEDRAGAARRLPLQLAVEIFLGLGFAVILVIVAWASSNAIRFVYGGY
jgi:hypothetical protein